MAILDAHQRTVRDGIRPEEVNHLLDSARMVRQTRAADGLLGYAGESGVVMAPHIVNSHDEWARQTAACEFIGKILNHGPDGQGDYGDQRYWVQELFEASPNGSTIHHPLTLENDALIRSEYPVRYVTATNLAEIPTASHDAPTNGTITVQVFMLLSPDGAAKFYFNSGGDASAVARFVAVGGAGAGILTTRDIKRHIVNEVWDGRWEFTGDVVPMQPWPLVDATEYLEFVTGADAEGLVAADGHILNAYTHGGLWYVAKPAVAGGGLPVLVKPIGNAMFGDYFEAHILDANGNRTTARVKVAKPFDLLQSPFDGQTIRWASNYEVRYSYWSSTTMRTAVRLAHGEEEEESFIEIVWKPYHAVEYVAGGSFTYPLWALEVGEAVTGVRGVPWLDLNIDSRIWVER